MKKLINSVEIAFWDQAIPLMSESPLIQNLVRETYVFMRSKDKRWVPILILSWSCAGLIAGYMLRRAGLIPW